MTSVPLKNAIGKWNSRLVGLAALGISALASAPSLPEDLRAIGITVVAVAGIVMVGDARHPRPPGGHARPRRRPSGPRRHRPPGVAGLAVIRSV